MSDNSANTPERPKRRRRFGRIYCRKWESGRRTWAAQYHCKVEQRRITRNFDSKKEAGEFLDEIEKRIIIDAYTPPPTLAEVEHREAEEKRPAPTLVGYARELLDARLKATLAAGTISLYEANLKALTGFYGKREGRRALRLDQITAASFLDYRAWRKTQRNSRHGQKGEVAASTINRDQSFLCRVLSAAVVDGLLESNPLAGLAKLREPRKPRRFLSKPEITRLLLACDAEFKPVVMTALLTGARRGEVLALRWSDINFADGKVTIFRTKVGSGDALDLHPLLTAELKALRALRNAPRPQDHLFLDSRGGPLTDVRKRWLKALEGAGLAGRDGLTFHSLRHSFATHFLTGGGNVRDLQAQLGHSRMETTQRYADMVSERRRATVMGMDIVAMPGGARTPRKRVRQGA